MQKLRPARGQLSGARSQAYAAQAALPLTFVVEHGFFRKFQFATYSSLGLSLSLVPSFLLEVSLQFAQSAIVARSVGLGPRKEIHTQLPNQGHPPLRLPLDRPLNRTL